MFGATAAVTIFRLDTVFFQRSYVYIYIYIYIYNTEQLVVTV